MQKKVFSLLITLLTTITGTAFAQITDPAPYCDAKFDKDALMKDYIKNVTFGTLSNNSDAQTVFPHYIFYNNLPPENFHKGNSYALTLIFGVQGNTGYGAWIDYNQDGIFSYDEKIAGTNGMNDILDITYNTIITKQITIPQTALSGTTRMRIRIIEDDMYTSVNGFGILPCNQGTTPLDIMDWGETEDYNITITEEPSGLEKINALNTFTVYPNPVSSHITIQTDLTGNNSYKIFNIMGQLLKTAKFNQPKQTVNMDNISQGVYYIQLFNNEQLVSTQKLLKQY